MSPAPAGPETGREPLPREPRQTEGQPRGAQPREPAPAESRAAAEAPPRDLREMLARGRRFLERHGLPEWRLEAELLIARAVGLRRLDLFQQLDRPVEPSEIQRARELLVRRAKREPTAYLTGQREFYGLEFEVGPAVLIPRPESEQLIDLARERLRERLTPGRPQRVFELGTGSGNLAVALAKHAPGVEVSASDRSEAALELARRNAARHGASVRFLPGDGFAALPADEAPFDLLLSNPPYIDPADRAGLAPEVREHEPALALFAPPGQPDFWVLEIVRAGLPRLVPGGRALIELGFDQAQRLAPLLAAKGLEARFHRDLDGHLRVLELCAPE
jgi:release factor glutamine methyltransferase